MSQSLQTEKRSPVPNYMTTDTFPCTLAFDLIVQQSPGSMYLRLPPLPLRASLQHASPIHFSQLSPLHHLRTSRGKWPRLGPSRSHLGLQTPYAARARTACLRSG